MLFRSSNLYRVIDAVLIAVTFLMTSCATNVQTQHRNTEWAQHAQDPVPNNFGEKAKKKSISYGFYEQDGSVASNSSWEAVAHYTYLAYRNIKIGFASYPYSISPSGRLIIIPETYYEGSTKHTLKIYDKKSNRFILRDVNPMVIRSYEWSKDEQTVKIFSENSTIVTSITIPKTYNGSD